MRFTAKRRGRCCNLSVDVALKVRFTTNGMCAKSNTQIYVTWTSNNRVTSSGDLYCCLLPQCETLRTFRSSFMITTQEIYFLVFRMPNAWKWPEMKMCLDLNLATFQYIDRFGYYHFCMNKFGLDLIIFFWTLSQLSVQFWDYRLLQDLRLPVDCSHQTWGAICCRHNAASPWANQRNSRTDDPQHNSNCDYTFDQVHSSIAATNAKLYVA